MQKVPYKIFEHTADIGITVEAADLNGIFTNAAAAMFDIMAERNGARRRICGKTLDISLAASDQEELLVVWLNELLSLSATKHLVFTEYRINHIDGRSLKASVTGESIKKFRINTEIKAATYHEFFLERGPVFYSAKVIFDV